MHIVKDKKILTPLSDKRGLGSKIAEKKFFELNLSYKFMLPRKQIIAFVKKKTKKQEKNGLLAAINKTKMLKLLDKKLLSSQFTVFYYKIKKIL